jgi:sec-independent protein translocase protein TatC
MSSTQYNGEQAQSLLQHLNEFRIRVMWAMAGLAVATVISFIFAPRLLAILVGPYGDRLQLLGPTEGIEIYFKVSLMTGAILAMPYMLYQLWLFIAPGLEVRERRYVYLFVPSATLLFLVGIVFTWYVLMPAAIYFLSNFMPQVFFAEWRAREYIRFTTTFLFWIGVSFEMPLIVYFLARVGIVTPALLKEQWRFAVVGIAVLAAMVTPSVDPVTMMLTMVPLLVLYIISIFMARIGQRQFERS